MAERQLATVTPLAPVTTNEWTEARQKYVLENFCGDAPLAVAMAFIELAMRRGLSPEARQLYLIKRKKKNQDTGRYEETWMQQTGIDGFRIIAERTGKYAGSDEPVFTWNHERKELEKASVTVWKLVQGQRCPFTATAYWEEYNAGQGQWPKMPRTMLAKCAEALALRKAFPEDLSGLYTDAEMDQADTPETGRPTVAVSAARETSKPAPALSEPARRQPVGGWNEFWPWAKQHGVKNEEDFVALVNRRPKDLTPQEARELVEAAMEELSRAVAARENGEIEDAEFVDVAAFDVPAADRTPAAFR